MPDPCDLHEALLLWVVEEIGESGSKRAEVDWSLLFQGGQCIWRNFFQDYLARHMLLSVGTCSQDGSVDGTSAVLCEKSRFVPHGISMDSGLWESTRARKLALGLSSFCEERWRMAFKCADCKGGVFRCDTVWCS